MDKVILPAGYKPSEDEEYMNPMQLEYFKQKLLEWRNSLLVESRETLNHLKEECPRCQNTKWAKSCLYCEEYQN